MKNRHLLVAFVLSLELILALILLQFVAGDASLAAALTGPAELPKAPATEYHVCLAGFPTCDYATIQEAVDAAQDADIIKVAGGLYAGVQAQTGITQAVYISKEVTIEGGYLPPFWTTPNPNLYPTIVDAQGQGRVLYITGDISPTLEGLHITGGDATGLGGGAWPGYDGTGGGIYVVTATASISNCTIYHNVAGRDDWSAGGGVYLHFSPAHLVHNLIYSNTAGMADVPGLAGEGGGVSIAGSAPTLIGNVVRDNVAASNGAGLGGGIYMEGGDPLLKNTLVQGNVASQTSFGSGGGIYNGPDNSALLVNTVLIDNTSGAIAASQGSGFLAELSSPRLVHTTINGNTGGDGSGVHALTYASQDCDVAMTNTLLVNQSVGITVTADATVRANGVLWFGNGANTGGAGLITITNAFTGNPALLDDGIHVRYESPAVDQGVDAGIAFDIDNQPRPYGALPDLGADELVVVTDTARPAVGATLAFIDGQGSVTTVEVPSGAVAQTTTLVLMPIMLPTHALPAGDCYAGHAFNLDAYCDSLHRFYLPLVFKDYGSSVQASGLSSWDLEPARFGACEANMPPPEPKPCPLVFQKPATITVEYTDLDVACVLNENSLTLYYWTGSEWKDAATTCSPPSTYVRNVAGNSLSLPICHLSEFAIGGQ